MIQVKVWNGAEIINGKITFAVVVVDDRRDDYFWDAKRSEIEYKRDRRNRKRLTNGQRIISST